MRKEFNDHTKMNHWEITPLKDVPEGEPILDSVQAMRRKRSILANKVYKWKSRLNLHDGHQEFAVNFYESYSHVISWASARLLLIHSLNYNQHTRQVNFTLAFPQADIEFPIYMKMPPGIKVKEGNRHTHALKLKKNLYGQKQGSRICLLHLTTKLKELNFKQLAFD